jgi:hypothetical protein
LQHKKDRNRFTQSYYLQQAVEEGSVLVKNLPKLKHKSALATIITLNFFYLSDENSAY